MLLFSASALAEKVTIYKAGVAVAEYELAEGDSVVFSPGAASLAEAVAGTYACQREVTLPAMPNMGVLISDNVDVAITAAGADKVNVVLPSCQYTMGGSQFDLPSATVECTVSAADGKYSLSGTFEGAINEKDSKVDFSAEISADGATFTMTQDMKYGTMPMVLHMVYTPVSE